MLRKNFLFLVIVLATLFAVAMQATVWQKTPPPPPIDITSTKAFQEYWTDEKNHTGTYWVIDSLGRDTTMLTLSFAKEYYKLDTQTKALATDTHAQVVLRGSTETLQGRLETVTPINTKLFPHSLGIYRNSVPQLLVKNRGYEVYDKQPYLLEREWLEDEIWTRLRLDPTQLPTGEFKCIPTLSLNLYPTTEEAEGQSDSLNVLQDRYWVKFKNRSVEIHYSRAFPHEISGWIERNGKNKIEAIRRN